MASTSSITSKEGIVYKFINPVSFGQYINSDYWVVGPALVSSIDPSTTLRSDGTAKNGSMLASQLSNNSSQGFDAATLLQFPYASSLNAANYLSASSPLVLNPGDRLLSVSSGDSYPAIRRASVLTCVSAEVPENYFRPAYTDPTTDGVDSSYFLSSYASKVANFDLTTYLTKTEPSGPLVTSSVSGFWFDPFVGANARFLRPAASMPMEDALIAAVVGDAALSLNYYNTNNYTKSSVCKFLTQIGIDEYSNLVNLGSRWADVGPQGSAKKFLMLFAGLMLNSSSMLNVGVNYPVSYSGVNAFPEDNQTFFVSSVSSTINYGYGGYSASDVGVPEWGLLHWEDPQFDNKEWVNTSSYGTDFRRFFAMKNWVGYLMAAKVMGLQKYWNHDPLFYYFNRYFAKEIEVSGLVSTSSIKEALAPTGKEWQYDFVSSMNSYYFPSDSSSRVSGVGFHGISSRSNILLYASSFTASAGTITVNVTNPATASSVMFIAGNATEPYISNGASTTSSLVYVKPLYSVEKALIQSSASLEVYDLFIPSSDFYLQAIWVDSLGGIVASSNALRIRTTVNF